MIYSATERAKGKPSAIDRNIHANHRKNEQLLFYFVKILTSEKSIQVESFFLKKRKTPLRSQVKPFLKIWKIKTSEGIQQTIKEMLTHTQLRIHLR